MRLKTFLKLMPIVAIALVLESCLKGDPTNFPEGSQTPFFIMTNNSDGTQNNPVSGLANFGNQALGFPHADASDTVTFFVALEGTGYATKDIDVSLLTKELDASVLKDNYASDSVNYLFMPDSLYKLLNTSATITKGTDYVAFKVVFYPSKFDQTQNYMLPISAQSSSDPNIKAASNYGILYYHAIGNVLTATYKYKYRRWNIADSTGSTTGTDSGPMFWAPINGSTVTFNGGYAKTVGLNAPYVLTFKKDPATGTLSNFVVKIDASLANGMAANGITITLDPTIIKMYLKPTYRYFKIWYKVNNGSGDRTLMDEYTWP